VIEIAEFTLVPAASMMLAAPAAFSAV